MVFFQSSVVLTGDSTRVSPQNSRDVSSRNVASRQIAPLSSREGIFSPKSGVKVLGTSGTAFPSHSGICRQLPAYQGGLSRGLDNLMLHPLLNLDTVKASLSSCIVGLLIGSSSFSALSCVLSVRFTLLSPFHFRHGLYQVRRRLSNSKGATFPVQLWRQGRR